VQRGFQSYHVEIGVEVVEIRKAARPVFRVRVKHAKESRQRGAAWRKRVGVELLFNFTKSRVFTVLTRLVKKTRPCPELEIITLRTLMINQAREVFCQRRFPASLIYCADREPTASCPVDSYAASPVVLDTALLPCFPPASGREGNEIRPPCHREATCD